jgi:PAS domain S-box-containing protein
MNPVDSRAFIEEIESSVSNIVSSADAFVAIDYDFCFLYVNQKAEKFYKRNRAELIGQKIEDVFPEQWNSGPFKNAIQSVIARKYVEINYNSPFIKTWVQLTGRPFENYYTFTFRSIDHKESLKKELRREVDKSKKPVNLSATIPRQSDTLLP